ncbi:MAG TPA: aminotransferase class V-fold PLP-dependent enzyme [Thermoanaerobaculia bacterium]|jgi:selenocysteine lyase/cysteine desulfurase|nr:aminotransferase class V-fold PLP-dependent enzyme [Thermoanaerobaculia bacterium]
MTTELVWATLISMDKRALRELFPVTKNVVYFNHAAVGPLSVRAYEAMERFASDQRDFGALHWRDWYAEYVHLRNAAARLIGAEASEIAILKNTSEGLSFVAEGFRWERGDNVVTTDLEFPSNSTPWRKLDRRGVETRVVRSHDGAFTVDDVEQNIDERTRIVSVSSVAFHNGFAADLDAIGAMCARRGVLFCVDAIQSVGVLPMDVRRANIAFLAADGHKWMCGSEGAAIFFVAAEHRDKLEVLENGWTNIERKGKFIDCPLELLPDARRFEAGSLNTSGIYGLRAAIDLLLEIGINDIAEESTRIAALLAERLDAIGWQVASPRPIRSAIVGVLPPSSEPSLLKWHRLLEENGIVCAPREGMLRFAPHFYNDEDEVERVIAVLKQTT